MNNLDQVLGQVKGLMSQLSDKDKKELDTKLMLLNKKDSKYTANLDDTTFQEMKNQLIEKLCQK